MKPKQNSQQIKIEKNIPIPPKRGLGLTETLRKLEIGDSIIWPTKSNYAAVAKQAGLPIKLTSRHENGHLRIWRIE